MKNFEKGVAQIVKVEFNGKSLSMESNDYEDGVMLVQNVHDNRGWQNVGVVSYEDANSAMQKMLAAGAEIKVA